MCGGYGSYGGYGSAFYLQGGLPYPGKQYPPCAVLFDALLDRSFIHAHWQSVLERGRFLVSKDGKRFVTASSLSTALSAARIRPTSVVYAIRTMIGRLP